MASSRKPITKLADLIPDDKNANRGTERGAALLENSLRDYGAGRSILLDRRGKIIAGNKTVEQAGSIGLDDVIVVQTDGTKLVAVQRMDLDLEKDSRAKALAIADNRVGQVSLEWDPAVLAELDKEIDLSNFWTEGELDELLSREVSAGEAPEAQLDRAEELRDVWQTAKGQLWEIPAEKAPRGVHRLLCGDSTSRADVSRLMGDVRAQMAFTDPPWNVGIGQDSNPSHRQREGLQNDKLCHSEFADFLGKVAQRLREVLDGDLYLVLGASEWPTLDSAIRSAGFHWSSTIIWVKDSFVLGRSKYHQRYEPIWYGWSEKSKSSYCAGRDQDNVWEIPRPKASEEHPTMKPPELVAKAIWNSSVPGGTLVDLFLGSGTTMVASEQLGRICYGMEIEPKYVAVALQRMKDMGLEPRLVS